MTLFLWILIVVLALTCIAKLGGLARGVIPQPTPKSEALDIAGNMVLIIYAAILLARM